MTQIRLLLVDDHQIVLDGLKVLFATMPTVTVVGVLNDSRQVCAFVGQKLADQPVDVVICDLNMPRQSGIDVTLQLRQTHPAVKVLLLTMADDATTIREAVRAGVWGYVLKTSGRPELEQALTDLMANRRYFDAAVLDTLSTLALPDRVADVPELAGLTERELAVLTLIAAEQSSAEIANQLCVSLSTVETHRRHLIQKLGVRNMAGLVKFAIRHGLAV
jgi:DNA-binding NarL/FixJ family response regulator